MVFQKFSSDYYFCDIEFNGEFNGNGTNVQVKMSKMSKQHYKKID